MNNFKSTVSITNNLDESIAILESLNNINAQDMISHEDVVVITPNWVNNKKGHANDAVVVGQNSLKTIIQFVKKQNPKRIVLATGSGSVDTTQVMKDVGYDKIIEEEGIEFIDLNKGPFIELSLDHKNPSTTKINTLIDQMTFLISFTQLKHHEEATMSAGIKNIALGWPPAEIHGYPKKNLGIHENLHGFITAMAKNIPINIAIVSANPAMIGTGPTKGISRHTGLVVCGNDPVATDTVSARLLGFKPQAIHYLFECSNNDIGISDLDKIDVKGLSIQEAEKIFSTKAYGQQILID